MAVAAVCLLFVKIYYVYLMHKFIVGFGAAYEGKITYLLYLNFAFLCKLQSFNKKLICSKHTFLYSVSVDNHS